MSSCMFRTAEGSAFNNVRADVQNRLARGLEKPSFIYFTRYRRLIGWLKSYHPEIKVDYQRLAGLLVQERDGRLMAKRDDDSNWHPFSGADFNHIADYIQDHFVRERVEVN